MHLTQQQLSDTFSSIRKVHFIGITSPFCSFSASYLLSKGITVTASEANQDSEAAQKWIEKGILFKGGHSAEYIHEDIDLVVFPNGIIPGNPEVEKTQESGLPYVLVQELLGIISQQYKTIAIAGTHGKTTTTALVIWLLHKTIGTPNFIVGDAKDKIAELGTNWESHPESEYLVIEACEYKKQFLARAPRPYISVITHIDLDHTDFYPNQSSYNQAFTEFLSHTTNTIIIDDAKKNEKEVLSNLPKDIAVVSTANLKKELGTIESTHLFGHHNQENLIRAAGVAKVIGISKIEALKALSQFPGISSRFEYKGTTKQGTLVYKDFAHNPQKITACLQGAKEAYPNKKLVVVYQPHNHERTKTFETELINSLKQADVLIVPNIYSLRESADERALISASTFVRNIQKKYPNKEVFFTDELGVYPKTLQKLTTFSNPNNLILIVSAGDVDKIIPDLLG